MTTPSPGGAIGQAPKMGLQNLRWREPKNHLVARSGIGALKKAGPSHASSTHRTTPPLPRRETGKSRGGGGGGAQTIGVFMAKKGKGRSTLSPPPPPSLVTMAAGWKSIFADEIGRGSEMRSGGISFLLIGFFGLIGLPPIVSGRKTISVLVGKTQRAVWV